MDESQNIEYKEIWKDEYLKWICGFANANGGRIFLGVDDDPPHKPVGLDNAERITSSKGSQLAHSNNTMYA